MSLDSRNKYKSTTYKRRRLENGSWLLIGKGALNKISNEHV